MNLKTTSKGDTIYLEIERTSASWLYQRPMLKDSMLILMSFKPTS